MLDYSSYIFALKTYNNLLNDDKEGRLAQTYLLENRDSDLTFSFALKLAKIIMLDEKNRKIGSSKIDKNIHPDLKIYGLDKKFSVDNASEIVSDVFVLPYEAERKVYIIANAEQMNDESQNKLLKTLEEPPMSSYFILCAKNQKSLLQTVISRAKKVLIEEPSEQKIEELLNAAGVLGVNAKIASICCSHDASKALKMVENSSFIKLYDNVFDMFRLMNSSRDIIKFVERFSGKDFIIQDFLTIVESVAMDVIYVHAKTENLVLNKHRIPELKVISSVCSVPALVKILKECFDFRESLYYNVNVTPALDEFMLKFVEVKVKCKK